MRKYVIYFKLNNITVLSVISFLADKVQTPEDERENETRESRSRNALGGESECADGNEVIAALLL